MNRERITQWLLITSALLWAGAVSAGSYVYTPSPIIAYNPTDGTILGAALFSHPRSTTQSGRMFGLQLMANRAKEGTLLYDYSRPADDSHLGYELQALYNTFKTLDYGRGNTTQGDSYHTIEGEQYRLKPQITGELGQSGRWKLYVDYRGGQERLVDDSPSTTFSAETGRYAVGGSYEHDLRGDRLNSASGSYLLLSLAYLPEESHQLSPSLYRIDAETRYFSKLGSSIISASRISMGYHSDDPGHLFRYVLGGEAGLRGFHANRFSGSRFYLMQQELRFPLWRIVDGVFFAEAGDVSYKALDNMRFVTGIGVRIGLPPDFRMKLRFDLGVSDEGERSLFVNFGQFY